MKKILLALMLASFTSFAQVETIRFTNMVRHIEVNAATGVPSGYIEVSALFRIPLPAALLGNNQLSKIAASYKSMYSIDRLDTIENVVYAVFNVQLPSMGIYKQVNGITTENLITDIDIQNALEAEYNVYNYRFSFFQLLPFDNIIGKSKIGTSWEESQE
jgi:hypothetical protein